MSVLKSIVVAMFAFQLALMVVNNIEIAPGVRMNTGQISNGQAVIPVNASINAIGDLRAALTNTGYNNRTLQFCGGGFPAYGSLLRDICLVVTIPSSPTVLERLIILVTSVITIILTIIILILGLIYNSTVGAIFLYSSIFGLIDPELGSVLGVAVGSLQAILVLWGLTEFIPTTSNKEA